MFLGEALVRRERLRVEREHVDPEPFEIGEVVAVVAELAGADGGVVARVEDQQHRAPLQALGERDRPLRAGQREVGGEGADLGGVDIAASLAAAHGERPARRRRAARRARPRTRPRAARDPGRRPSRRSARRGCARRSSSSRPRGPGWRTAAPAGGTRAGARRAGRAGPSARARWSRSCDTGAGSIRSARRAP